MQKMQQFIVPETRVHLTNNLNQIFSLIQRVSKDCKNGKIKKADKNVDFYVSVAGSRIELPTSGL